MSQLFGRSLQRLTSLATRASTVAQAPEASTNAFKCFASGAQRQNEHPVYVVFGAGGGVGSALSQRLVGQEGSKVVLIDGNTSKLDQFKSKADLHAVDVTKFSEVEDALRSIKDQHGSIDGIANVTGEASVMKPIHITSEDEYQHVMNSNVRTAFNILKATAPLMIASGGGSIALTSAAISHLGSANHDVVAAAKGAVSSLALGSAATYAPNNIRVNCVAPGLLRTPMTKKFTDSEDAKEESLKVIPIGRFGEADEAAAAFEFLLHPSNSYITGQTIMVDGGFGSLRTSTPDNKPAQSTQQGIA